MQIPDFGASPTEVVEVPPLSNPQAWTGGGYVDPAMEYAIDATPTPSRLSIPAMPPLDRHSPTALLGPLSISMVASTIVAMAPFTTFLFTPLSIAGIGLGIFGIGRFRDDKAMETLAFVIVVGLLVGAWFSGKEFNRTPTVSIEEAPTVQFENPMVGQ